MGDDDNSNTDLDLKKATYIKIPVRFLVILWDKLMCESEYIQQVYAVPILGQLKTGELS